MQCRRDTADVSGPCRRSFKLIPHGLMACVSTDPNRRSLWPPTSSISIAPTSGVGGAEASGDAGAAAIRTGTKAAIGLRLAVKPASLRHRNNKLLAIPNFRATAETDDVRVASTACCRSSLDHRRRVSITTILLSEICPDVGTEPNSGRYNHRLSMVSSISSLNAKQGVRGRTLTLGMPNLSQII